MTVLKTAGLTAALLGAAAIGASVAPVATGQSSARIVSGSPVQVWSVGGGRLGISVRDVDPGDASGVIVESVEEGSPAEKAGFRKGDVVVEFDGERVRSVRQFTRLVNETPGGRTVAAAAQRDGQRVTLNVTPREAGAFRMLEGENWRAIEELRNLPSRVAPRVAPPATPRPPVMETFIWPGTSQLGVTLNDLSPQLAEYFGTKEGVLVSAVRDESPAAKAGVKAGDVITAVNGVTVGNAAELRRRTQRLEPGEEFTLGIVRDKKSLTVKGKTESRPRRGTIL